MLAAGNVRTARRVHREPVAHYAACAGVHSAGAAMHKPACRTNGAPP